MLTLPWCAVCKTMARMLGDRVTVADGQERTDLVALSGMQASPWFLVYDEGGKYLGSFGGAMPVSAFEKRVAALTGR
jgi:thioredoxin-related protein